jgi:hypothetical protein
MLRIQANPSIWGLVLNQRSYAIGVARPPPQKSVTLRTCPIWGCTIWGLSTVSRAYCSHTKNDICLLQLPINLSLLAHRIKHAIPCLSINAVRRLCGTLRRICLKNLETPTWKGIMRYAAMVVYVVPYFVMLFSLRYAQTIGPELPRPLIMMSIFAFTSQCLLQKGMT